MSKHVTLNTIAPASETPWVKSDEVTAGAKPDASDKARSALAVSAGLTAVINRNAEADATRLLWKSELKERLADYWQAIADNEDNTKAGETAKSALETATANVSRTLADAILADAMTRKEARAEMAAEFGTELSKTTGKPTSKPLEPGNTIAKRVSSVTIAAEYAMTGQLPDKGGNGLALLDPAEVQAELADYFDQAITVRAASERIERLISAARINVPLEMNPAKLLTLAGKIETARLAIADDTALAEAYAVLFQTIGAIPFPAPEGE